ncbi:MAG: hypothetical protein KME31_21770 [Tolypothrix carrinoi HA7290-LM1]|nr:hypothetical protein [Tolypothrix carrinoi HA7290-LM1]
MLQVGGADGRCFKPGNPSNALPPQRTASPMPHAQCPMPNAPCPMPNAQCPIFKTIASNDIPSHEPFR